MYGTKSRMSKSMSHEHVHVNVQGRLSVSRRHNQTPLSTTCAEPAVTCAGAHQDLDDDVSHERAEHSREAIFAIA